MKKVLVVAVHPDDETLGCGGTILKHKASGDKVFWLIITSMNEEDGFNSEIVAERSKEIKVISSMYGFDNVYQLCFPTMQLDKIPFITLTESISKVVEETMPDIVYLPFKGDIHTDHQVGFKAAYSCTKSFRHPYIKKIMMMEVVSETEFSPNMQNESFIPNLFIDITNFIERKIEIMKMYNSELYNHPFPRSEKNIRSLAIFRGATASCEYAESFMIIKEIL